MLFRKKTNKNPELGKGMYKGYRDTCTYNAEATSNSLKTKEIISQLEDYSRVLYEKGETTIWGLKW